MYLCQHFGVLHIHVELPSTFPLWRAMDLSYQPGSHCTFDQCVYDLTRVGPVDDEVHRFSRLEDDHYSCFFRVVSADTHSPCRLHSGEVDRGSVVMAATLVHVGASWTVPVSDGIILVTEQTVTPNDASDINDASVSEVRIHHAI